MLRQSPFIVVYKKEGGEQDGNDTGYVDHIVFRE